MGRHRWILATLLALIVGDHALAQSPAAPSPMIQHYRAYAAALERGDLVTAETEAAAALAASVEKYGDGGKTAVFALNLAGVRLVQGKYEAAVEPARKALALAEAQGDASGVSTLAARLILGRAELPTGGYAAEQRLVRALEEASKAPDLAGEAYPAAVELAIHTFDAGHFDTTRQAWNMSLGFAAGSAESAELVRARALTGVAAAGIMDIAAVAPRQQLGTRIPVADDRILQYDQVLIDAMGSIRDQASEASPDGRMSRAQLVYAQAYAWQSALYAKLASEGRRLPVRSSNAHVVAEIGASRHGAPACPVKLRAEPSPTMPPVEQMNGRIGSVVLRISVDEAGSMTQVEVAASVGGPAFVESVMSVARQWRYEKLDDAPAGCRMTRQDFLGVRYIYR